MREQLRYTVRRHGGTSGLLLSLRSPGLPECILRDSFHRRKSARLPDAQDIAPHLSMKLMQARGAAKVPELLELLGIIELCPDLQPLLPVNVLAAQLAAPSRPLDMPDDLTAPELAANQQIPERIEEARIHVRRWLERAYFPRIHATPDTRTLLLLVLDDYAERYAQTSLRRTASKDLVLAHLPELSRADYEHSQLRAQVHYVCVRFRRALREIQ